MNAGFSPDVLNDLQKIKKRDKKLYARVQMQIIRFKENPKHPSLRVHKLSGEFDSMWSIAITKSIRMVYRLLSEDRAYFIDIGTHDQVYKK